MPMESFSELLGKIRDYGEDSDREQATFKVSAKVAEAMFSLRSERTKEYRKASPYYEETASPASANIAVSLTLWDLKEEIAKASTISELHGLRRRFARGSHPDRQAASDGASANWVMATANHMIDEAICAMRRDGDKR